jgi:hypothetical protein
VETGAAKKVLIIASVTEWISIHSSFKNFLKLKVYVSMEKYNTDGI